MHNIKENILDLGSSILSWMWLKAPLSFLATVIVFMIGEQNIPSMTMLVILITLDLLTAIMREYKLGHEIESRKAVKTAFKLAVYGLLVSSAHLTESILPGTTYLNEAIISFLAITELISILENVGDMGYAIPKKALNKLRSLRDEK